MNITIIGPWVLLIVGGLAFIGAAWKYIFSQIQPKPLFVLILGGALCGTGVYGPVFLSSYIELIKAITSMNSSATTETYSEVLDEIAQGSFSPEYRDIILKYAVNQPVENLDSLLDVSAKNAKRPEDKNAFIDAKKILSAKEKVAAGIVKTMTKDSVNVSKIEDFDPTMKTLVSRQILKLPPSESVKLKGDLNNIKKYKAIQPMKFSRTNS